MEQKKTTKEIISWAINAQYTELLESQAAVIAAIKECGVHAIFSYTDPQKYFQDQILIPKLPKQVSRTSVSPLTEPLTQFVNENKELLAKCYSEAIAKNTKPGMLKAGFGATLHTTIPNITVNKSKINEVHENLSGSGKLEMRFFFTPDLF